MSQYNVVRCCIYILLEYFSLLAFCGMCATLSCVISRGQIRNNFIKAANHLRCGSCCWIKLNKDIQRERPSTLYGRGKKLYT